MGLALKQRQVSTPPRRYPVTWRQRPLRFIDPPVPAMYRVMIMSRFRFINLLTAVWTLVAVPALCTGGILTHPCECEPASPCHDSHHDEEENDDPGCGHESSCSIDPCKFVSLRCNERHDELQVTSVMQVATSPVLETCELFLITNAQLGLPGEFVPPPISKEILSSTVLLI